MPLSAEPKRPSRRPSQGIVTRSRPNCAVPTLARAAKAQADGSLRRVIEPGVPSEGAILEPRDVELRSREESPGLPWMSPVQQAKVESVPPCASLHRFQPVG